MSLFGTIQLAGNTLRATEVGLHVVGNNIANANTPGYIREEAIFTPAPDLKSGSVIVGLGVQVDGVVQKVDQFLLERLRSARSDRAGAEIQNNAYKDLEALLGELSDNDLSSDLSSFFNAIDEVLKQPGDAAVRKLVVTQARSLSESFNRLGSRVEELRREYDSQVQDAANDINRLAEEIQILNTRIAHLEGGGSSPSQAGALRTERINALDELAQLVEIRVSEQTSGGVAVHIGGEYLVYEGLRQEVVVATNLDEPVARSFVHFEETDAPLELSGGDLLGRYAARDEIIGAFSQELDELAASLAWEFNRLHTQGQGLVGFQSLTSVNGVADANVDLETTGLPFTPANGGFDIVVRNKSNDQSQTYSIQVDLNGLDGDSSLSSIAAAIDAAEGISASVTSEGKLALASDSSDIEFTFANDTSGFLAAIGLNTFFAGSTARDLGVNAELNGVTNANKFAASLGGVGEDTLNAERMAAFFEQPLDSKNSASLADLYDHLVNQVAQGSAVAASVAEGFRAFEASLEGEHQAISGVSLDEEAIRMITLQRTYQASARLIQTISELMDILVNL